MRLGLAPQRHFTFRGQDPNTALRTLLVAFPFLPSDAGLGADRVIGGFAEAFAAQNPDAFGSGCDACVDGIHILAYRRAA